MRVSPSVLFVLSSFFMVYPPVLLPSVVINEIMKDPVAVPDRDGEWFELYNPGEETVDLGGWIIQDLGGDYHQIPVDSGPAIPPGGYAVLGRNGDPALNGGYSPDYTYEGVTLSNSEDEILLLDASGVKVDSVAYDDTNWPSDPGQSMELIVGREENAVGENWLSSTVPYGDGDLGTPGAENSATGTRIGGDEPGEGPQSGFEQPVFETYPNPFRGTTTIRLNGIPRMTGGYQPRSYSGSNATLRIYSLRGRMVRDLWEGAPESGSRIVWNGKDDRGNDLPPGMYIIRMNSMSGLFQKKVHFAGR